MKPYFLFKKNELRNCYKQNTAIAPNCCYKHTTKVMDLEFRKNNTYFDKKGKQILAGDLLKVFHFISKNKKYYMYHIAVIEETKDFPVMAIKGYNSEKPHCRMYVLANNEQRVFKDAEIISEVPFQNRLKIKVK